MYIGSVKSGYGYVVLTVGKIGIPEYILNKEGKLTDEELAARKQQPLKRKRLISKALKIYAQSVSSADKGGVRMID